MPRRWTRRQWPLVYVPSTPRIPAPGARTTSGPKAIARLPNANPSQQWDLTLRATKAKATWVMPSRIVHDATDQRPSGVTVPHRTATGTEPVRAGGDAVDNRINTEEQLKEDHGGLRPGVHQNVEGDRTRQKHRVPQALEGATIAFVAISVLRA